MLNILTYKYPLVSPIGHVISELYVANTVD